MAAPRKPCPYERAEDLRAALMEAGSVAALAHSRKCSPNTVRRWCRELGVETRTGKLGRPTECPYPDAAALTAAIEEAGGLAPLATIRGNDPRTLRRWCRELGVEVQSARRKTEGGEVLARMGDPELEAIVSAVGPAVLGRILDLSHDAIRAECKRRGIQGTPSASPRAQMLARRVRELEKREEALAELRAEIRQAAETAAASPPPIVPPAKLTGHKRHGDLEVVVHVSDLQYGERVDAEEVPGGRYSPAVFEEERLPRYLEAVEALIQNAAELGPLRRVWIACAAEAQMEGSIQTCGSAAAWPSPSAIRRSMGTAVASSTTRVPRRASFGNTSDIRPSSISPLHTTASAPASMRTSETVGRQRCGSTPACMSPSTARPSIPRHTSRARSAHCVVVATMRVPPSSGGAGDARPRSAGPASDAGPASMVAAARVAMAAAIALDKGVAMATS